MVLFSSSKRQFRMKCFATVVVLATIGLSSAKADADGYFCSSPAFLAYEFSFSKEPFDQHKLYVIRLGAGPIKEPQWLRIPDFPVHSMKCFSDRVEFLGWEKRYVYSVSGAAVTAIREEKLPAPGKFPEGSSWSGDNLGASSLVVNGPSTYTYRLTTDSPDGTYEIRLQRRKTKSRCEAFVESNLVKTNRENKTIAVLKLYAGTVELPCGE